MLWGGTCHGSNGSGCGQAGPGEAYFAERVPSDPGGKEREKKKESLGKEVLGDKCEE